MPRLIAPQMLVYLDKTLLTHVFGIVPIPDDPKGHPQGHLLVLPQQRGKGIGVSLLSEYYQPAFVEGS